MTPYEKPMDCGNHEDVRWAEISQKVASGIKITSDKNLMQVIALPYTDEEMEKKQNTGLIFRKAVLLYCASAIKRWRSVPQGVILE